MFNTNPGSMCALYVVGEIKGSLAYSAVLAFQAV